MRHPILIAALAVVTIGVGAARADEHDEALMAHRQPQSSSEQLDAMSHPGFAKVAEMESEGRDDDDDDDEADDEDDGEDNAGGSSAIFPIPQSGAPATVPAPKNPLINGNARPSVVVQ